MNQEELEETFEEEKKQLKLKYFFITVFVAIVVAVISSEISLFYYANKFEELSEIEKKAVDSSYSNEKNIEIIFIF